MQNVKKKRKNVKRVIHFLYYYYNIMSFLCITTTIQYYVRIYFICFVVAHTDWAFLMRVFMSTNADSNA